MVRFVYCSMEAVSATPGNLTRNGIGEEPAVPSFYYFLLNPLGLFKP
jgi:hypothetical protein